MTLARRRVRYAKLRDTLVSLYTGIARINATISDIPIRNCSTGRDLNFTLRKFADSARQSYQEFQNLYARDLQCPQEWQERCRRILPTEVQWGGRLDLFQWLPQCARSEVMMTYVGSEGSSSGFHRCFSSTVAMNLLVDSDGQYRHNYSQ